MESPPTTIDAVLDGHVVLEQPAHGHGYRFNVDSIHLARFACHAGKSFRRVVDLGAGVGTVGICIAQLASVRNLVLVEIDNHSCALARSNAARAGLASKVVVIASDVAEYATQAHESSPDLVVANPPYTAPGAGRSPKGAALARSRQGDFKPFVLTFARLLSASDSRACMCFPTTSLVVLFRAIAQAQMRVTRMAFVHPQLDRPARIALVEMASEKYGPALLLEPPIMETSRIAT